MKRITLAEQTKLLEILEEVHRVSTMEETSFSMDEEKDKEIKDEIHPWTWAWIEMPTQEAIDLLKGKEL